MLGKKSENTQSEIDELTKSIPELKEEKMTLEEDISKLTKQRISIGQERQILNQAKEEIKAAYKAAGMSYPYE